MNTEIFGGLKSLPRALGIVAINIVAGTGTAGAGDVVGHQMSVFNPTSCGSIETVYFTNREQMSVRVVRGTEPTGGLRVRREIATFGTGTAQHVTVFRGITEPILSSNDRSPDNSAPSPRATIDQIDPADSTRPSMTRLRSGITLSGPLPADLFSPGGNEQYVRIANAVHEVESRYGTDLRMWRLDNLSGPQGPMQVSAAAALDVGGGNRFDVYENVLLGRAYLTRLFRRYGSWSDALAAYNWGPGNVDQWIARGRHAEQLPTETIRYIERVLRLVLFGSGEGIAQQRISRR